jgi:hypothetical protein
MRTKPPVFTESGDKGKAGKAKRMLKGALLGFRLIGSLGDVAVTKMMAKALDSPKQPEG